MASDPGCRSTHQKSTTVVLRVTTRVFFLQLPLAPDALAVQAEAAEQREVAEARRLWEEDEATLRALRMGLREIATKLLCTRQWKAFWLPVDPEDDPDYYSQVGASHISSPCPFPHPLSAPKPPQRHLSSPAQPLRKDHSHADRAGGFLAIPHQMGH